MASIDNSTLHGLVVAAELPNPPFVIQRLEREYGITTRDELERALADQQKATCFPALWRVRLNKFLESDNVRSAPIRPTDGTQPSTTRLPDFGGRVVGLLYPNGNGNPTGTQVVVAQGDLTACRTDAIVNAANTALAHGGGLAGAIVRKGGSVIQAESQTWILAHGELPVGSAMSTSAGRLPSKYVIHTVGPNVARFPSPTRVHAQQLRSAVWSALVEAARLGATSVAIPGISTGIFGYPRDLGATEIVRECIRFTRERTATTIRLIVLMNNDDPTVSSFTTALNNAEMAAAARTQVQGLPKEHELMSPSQPLLLSTPPQRSSQRSELTARTILPKAAGILLARSTSKGFEVLLGVEYRPFDRNPGRYVNFLGGKSDPGESPSETASREFSEEVSGLVSRDEAQRLLDDGERSQKLWLPFAKYVLFIAKTKDQRSDKLPQEYAKKKRDQRLECGAEHDLLLWVPWQTLMATLSSASEETRPPDLLTPQGYVALSSMLWTFLKSFRIETERALTSLLFPDLLQQERCRVNNLCSLSNDEIVESFCRKYWRLCLSSPPIPPPPPIRLLMSDDPHYQQTIKALPAEMATRVVSVRQVNASSRIGDYSSELKRQRASSQTIVTEKEPLFHGTPERWRATAIALNGFDLSIRLVGRSCGDGVYSSSDVQVANGYSGGTGSILFLKGIVIQNSPDPRENTILANGTFHIFPNPKCALPRMIVDFATTDSRDSVEEQRQSVQENYRRILEHRERLKTSMKAQEEACCRDMANRLRASLEVYTRKLTSFERFRQEESDSINLVRQFFIERQQFDTCLPIYEMKDQTIQALRDHPVVVLTADTGSGKSTQLPQYVLDHVLEPNESRRIAVLQPRRVNAVSLARRVAEERGFPPGLEVGYTIGRGEGNTTTTTRIEYMTHGLFVQLARDGNKLLERYCVVVVDEAHERSIDVDLSLALLKRTLADMQGSREPLNRTFKVIVTSATIDDDSERIRRYLDPSTTSSTILHVPGRAFPVHIQHRDDVQADTTAVGTAGVGKILTSTAIQTAVDILKTTAMGNILVFLPGEGSINDALEVAARDLAMEEKCAVNFSGTGVCFRIKVPHGNESLKERMSQTNATSGKGKKAKKNASSTGTNVITVLILGFHGKLSRAERDLVLHPPPDHRLVILSTNVAETGVTLPDVRYVVDTGLERRVRWNPTTDINEMVTVPVTRSSMKQRAGRAGRTASGICIRLFPEPAGPEEAPRPEDQPVMQSSMIHKAVLLNKYLQHVNESPLDLLDPIDSVVLARAEARLTELGAIDLDGRLTREGSALLTLGVPLRLGRFLLASNHVGCLGTAAKLVALLMATEAPERLLPTRRRDGPTTVARGRDIRIDELVHPSGDHLTLLNLVEAFEDAQQRGQGLKWCEARGLDPEVFLDAQTTHAFLLKTLEHLGFRLEDDPAQIDDNGGLESSLRRALCAAYADQLAQARTPGSPQAGFARILDLQQCEGTLRAMTDFCGRTQPAAASGDGAATEVVDQAEAIVRVATRSTLWHDRVLLPTKSQPPASEQEQQQQQRLVIFGSQLLTDSGGDRPSIQLVTFVSEEDIRNGAPTWCRLVDFDQLLEVSARTTLRLPLPSPGMRATIVADRGRWLRQLEAQWPMLVATVVGQELVVTCPRRSTGRIEPHVRQLLAELAPETVTLQLPEGVDMGRIIGRRGRGREALETELQAFLRSECSGAGRQHRSQRPVVVMRPETRELELTLEGPAKALFSVVVGRVQAHVVASHGERFVPTVRAAAGAHGQEMLACPRLAWLLSPVMPPRPPAMGERDACLLELAHVLVWRAGASLYGGFVRDWVVRGEAANDLDVAVTPPETTVDGVERCLRAYLEETRSSSSSDGGAGGNGGRRVSLRITRRWQKGAATTLTLDTAAGLTPSAIDVDLVDPAALVATGVAMAPGVDCDAGNLLLNRREALRLKVPTAGGTLRGALEHVRRQEFVFYYALVSPAAALADRALRRLRKYLGRGWTCLTPVPGSVPLSPSERQQVRPSSSSDV